MSSLFRLLNSEGKLVKVSLKVLRGYPVIHADDRSLEQTPEALDTHGVDVAVHEGLEMADGFMPTITGGGTVALELIGNEQIGIEANAGIDEWAERFGLSVSKG